MLAHAPWPVNQWFNVVFKDIHVHVSPWPVNQWFKVVFKDIHVHIYILIVVA